MPGSSPRAPDPDFSISITKSGSDCTHSCAPDTSTPFFSGITVMKTNANERPPLHLIDSEADRLADLALRVEHSQPAVASMLLAEIDRAEIHTAETLPANTVAMNSHVTFVDEGSGSRREVQRSEEQTSEL